jgi:uncharacterized phiE125 gp8 family phage protein
VPLQLITSPSLEPISLTQAKAHLKIDATDEDALITALIAAARTRTEWYTGRALITQSWTQWLDDWPQTNCVEIALPPLQNLTELRFYRADDSASILDASSYQVDSASAPARVALKPATLPPLNPRPLNAVAIAFTAGYGDEPDDVPAPLREAILELIAFLFMHRGDAPADLPPNILAMLEPYRIFKF